MSSLKKMACASMMALTTSEVVLAEPKMKKPILERARIQKAAFLEEATQEAEKQGEGEKQGKGFFEIGGRDFYFGRGGGIFGGGVCGDGMRVFRFLKEKVKVSSSFPIETKKNIILQNTSPSNPFPSTLLPISKTLLHPSSPNDPRC